MAHMLEDLSVNMGLAGSNPGLWMLVVGQLFCLHLYERLLLCFLSVLGSADTQEHCWICKHTALCPETGWDMLRKKKELWSIELVYFSTSALEVLTGNASMQLLTPKCTPAFKLAHFVD